MKVAPLSTHHATREINQNLNTLRVNRRGQLTNENIPPSQFGLTPPPYNNSIMSLDRKQLRQTETWANEEILTLQRLLAAIKSQIALIPKAPARVREQIYLSDSDSDDNSY